MLVWVVVAPIALAGVLVIAVRVVAALVPLVWVTPPEPRWWGPPEVRVLPVVEPAAVIPPPRRELGQ